jgi:cell division protein FtsB
MNIYINSSASIWEQPVPLSLSIFIFLCSYDAEFIKNTYQKQIKLQKLE